MHFKDTVGLSWLFWFEIVQFNLFIVSQIKIEIMRRKNFCLSWSYFISVVQAIHKSVLSTCWCVIVERLKLNLAMYLMPSLQCVTKTRLDLSIENFDHQFSGIIPSKIQLFCSLQCLTFSSYHKYASWSPDQINTSQFFHLFWPPGTVSLIPLMSRVIPFCIN